MRKFWFAMIGALCLFGITTLLGFSEHPRVSLDARGNTLTTSETLPIQPWTSKDLMEMAAIYDQQADELQAEAVRIEQEATTLALRPYMEPKGFRRNSLMLVATARWKAAKEMRELAVMHRAEGERLLALEKQEGG